jgi:hypothetical protein
MTTASPKTCQSAHIFAQIKPVQKKHIALYEIDLVDEKAEM